MARGRMMSQSIAEDLAFNAMSIEAQFMYMRSIPHLDRDGLITGHPVLLKAKIAPLVDGLSKTMAQIITEWSEAGLVISYEDNKTPALFFTGFTKNQIGMRYEREPASLLPPPPGYVRMSSGLYPASTQPTPDPLPAEPSIPPSDIRQSSGNHPAISRQSTARAGAEVELEVEVKRTTTTTAPLENEPKPKVNSGSSGGSRDRRTDNNYARLCSKFEGEGFGTLTPLLGEEIGALLDEFPVDWISDAMTVAVGANKRQTRYVRGILVKWRANGRNTPKSHKSTPAPLIPLVAPEWMSYGIAEENQWTVQH